MKAILVALALLAGVATSAAAQAVAFKTGERVRGDGLKDCFYSALGQDYVHTIAQYGICPLSVPVSVQQPLPAPTGTTGFKVGEVSRGAVKDCYYSALGEVYVSTVSAMALCPLSVTVP